jgi:hypothetical protein
MPPPEADVPLVDVAVVFIPLADVALAEVVVPLTDVALAEVVVPLADGVVPPADPLFH